MAINITGPAALRPSDTTRWDHPWYEPAKNQIARNLDVASPRAGSWEFGVLVMTEHATDVTTADLNAGLPHLASSDRDALIGRMLGALTWSDAGAVGLSLDEFPDTTEEAVRRFVSGNRYA